MYRKVKVCQIGEKVVIKNTKKKMRYKLPFQVALIKWIRHRRVSNHKFHHWINKRKLWKIEENLNNNKNNSRELSYNWLLMTLNLRNINWIYKIQDLKQFLMILTLWLTLTIPNLTIEGQDKSLPNQFVEIKIKIEND